MTDLTFCYRHMTRDELTLLDTIEDGEFSDGNLSDEELNIPHHMIPPNPEDADTLPSQQHPSYPYGNPLRMGHPAKYIRPSNVYDPSSRIRFSDAMFHAAARPESSLQWTDLGLELLLPRDQEKMDAERAAQARKLASGAGASGGSGGGGGGGGGGTGRGPPPPPAHGHPHGGPPPVVVASVPLPMDEDYDEDEDSEEENDENDENLMYQHDQEGNEEDEDEEEEEEGVHGSPGEEEEEEEEEYDEDAENDENAESQSNTQHWHASARHTAEPDSSF